MRLRLKKSDVADLAWVIVITIASSLLMYSTWRETSPMDSPDIRAHQANAVEFVYDGVVPYRGQGLSYSGWGPPGTSYLMIPGVLIMADPRLAEVPGAVLLHFGTLLFLFLIVRRTIGRGAAWAVVPIAGFLPFTGPTLWPNGHPFFVAGMLYFLLRWVLDRTPHAFSAALLMAGLGMYVYFTLAPALIAMMVIALLFRAPISWKSLAATLGILLLVWWPYLRFESGRGFVDIQSMILRRDLQSAESSPSQPVYCYASYPGETDFISWHYIAWTGTSDPNRVIYAAPGRLASFALQVCTILNKFDRNFDSGYFLFGGEPSWTTAALFMIALAGFWVLLFRSLCLIKKVAEALRRAAAISAGKFLLAAAIGAGLIFLLVRPVVWGTLLVGDPDWNLPARLLLDQTRAFGIVLWISICLGLGFASRWNLDGRSAAILAAMIGVSGFLLLTLSEIERSWRFWWFWPLQSISIVAAVEGLRRSWKVPAKVSTAVCILAVGLYFPYRSAASKVDSIAHYGYGGRESGQIQALDWISTAAKEDPGRTIAIGVTRYHGEEDPTRPWGWLEFGLTYIDKTPNAVAGDIRPGDDFRVLEFIGADQDHHPVECPWEGYTPVWESRRFTLCQRVP